MIEKRTVLDRIHVATNGTLQVRFLKQTVDGGRVIAQEFHRTAIPPGVNVDDQMQAVNSHLQALGYGAVANYQALTDLAAKEHSAECMACRLQS